MRIFLTPQFVRMFDNLERSLQEEALEKIETFKNVSSHRALRVHKLRGKYKNCYAFSINYQVRIIFQYAPEAEHTVYLLAIGDHNVYK